MLNGVYFDEMKVPLFLFFTESVLLKAIKKHKTFETGFIYFFFLADFCPTLAMTGLLL